MRYSTRIIFGIGVIGLLAGVAPASSEPSWFGSSPSLVSEARKYMGTNPTARKKLWCATFMNMVLAKAGYDGTHSDAAKSFAYYGRRISEPEVGAIAVLTRGKRGGHVGVVSGIDKQGNPIIISGNHNKRVGEAIYPRARVIAYVMPAEGRSGTTQLAARSRPNGHEPALESPIAELLAAIEAEMDRGDRAARPAAPAQPAAPQRVVQQGPGRSAPAGADRGLSMDPFLADLLGMKDRAQPAPRQVQPPQQRERRVQLTPGHVALR